MSDLEQLKSLIETNFNVTNGKIESIQTTLQNDIATIRTDLGIHNDRITSIEDKLNSNSESSQVEEIKLQIEILKQDRLRNNIRLTGLPPIAFESPNDTVISIDNVLDLGLIPSDFSAYADRNKSSLIVSFNNYSHKRLFMNELQKRRSLLAEEVFESIESSSNIYANDQLTPYFASLFQSAWKAKKNGQIYSASSLGGRVKVKKFENSSIIMVETQQQLNDIVNSTHETEAQNQSNGLSEVRNDDENSNSNNNNISNGINGTNSSSNSTSNNNKSEIIRHKKGTQPATNNQSLQRYIERKQIGQRSSTAAASKVSSKIRENLHQRRTDSRDRAYRGNIHFDSSPPYQPATHRNDDRYRSYKRSPSPSSSSHHQHGKPHRNEYTTTRKYNRGRY